MTMRFVDSFGHYNTSMILRKYSSFSGPSSAWAISAGNGRWGGASLRLTQSNVGASQVWKSLDNQQKCIVGAAVRYNGFPSGSTWSLFSLIDGGTSQIDVRT